jgi:hypothetical protein
VTSPAKLLSNRRNAQRSTGPRTAVGKAHSRHNALRHGLSRPAPLNPATAHRLEELASGIAGGRTGIPRRELALIAAEAQLEVERVQQATVGLINEAAKRIMGEAAERAALAVADRTTTLLACGRYERRALARRNRALRALHRLESMPRNSLLPERVGSALPKYARRKDRHNLFKEPSLTLDLGELLKSITMRDRSGCGSSMASCAAVSWAWHTGEHTVAELDFSATLEGDRVVLRVQGRAWGQAITQEIVVTRRPTQVGGVRWSVHCPETGKTVKYLYLLPRQRHFRSRHAAKLKYRSNTLPPAYRHMERAQRLAERLGGVDPDIEPPRPKHMQGRTYDRLREEMWQANLRSKSEVLRRLPSDLIKEARRKTTSSGEPRFGRVHAPDHN